MTVPTECIEDMMQQELDTEINLINDFLMDLYFRKQRMSHFVSGLQVVVKSLLSAVHNVKRRHPQDDKKTIQEEKGTTTKPCPKEEEELSKVEEQEDNTMTEDEEELDSNPPSALMMSLNSTLGDLEQAEEKLTEMDCRNHIAKADQSSGDSVCSLDIIHEFLADFRQKLLQSCKEFMSMESQTLALLEEKKSLQDFSFQLTNSPRKTMKPKEDSLIAAASDEKSIVQKAESEDSAPFEMESTLPKDICQNIPSDTAAAMKDVDSNDNISSETRPALPQKDESTDTAPTDTSATSKKDNIKDNTSSGTKNTKENTSSGTKNIKVNTSSSTKNTKDNTSSGTKNTKDNTSSGAKNIKDNTSSSTKSIKENTSPDTKNNIKETDDKDTSSNTAPLAKDASAPPTTEGIPDDKKQLPEQIVDEEYDYVSPIGMKRMFGSYSQEPKIFLPPTSPYSSENSPSMARLNLEVSPVSVESET